MKSTSRLSRKLWVIPLACVLAGVVLSLSTIAIDKTFDYRLVPQSISGGPDAAMEILGTVAASMVSLAALVLTITMVVVQLAMGQFSPRIVQRILEDKPSQLAIGIFVGTFAHAMLALREVQTAGDDGVVPGLAVVVAFVLVIISIMVLVWYVHHIGRSLRVAALIELVGTATRGLLDEVYTDHGAPPRFQRPTICIPRSGVITHIDYAALVRIAEAGDCVLTLLPALGEFVPAGAPLFESSIDSTRIDVDAAIRAIQIGLERTLDQDTAYGLRMLVDIAERSLSEPFLDPTTAVQAIDRLYDCLRQLAPRPFPDGQHRDGKGHVRVVTRSMTWDDYVHLAFDEIRIAGAGSLQVARRLRAALEDLLTVAPPERKASLNEQLYLLKAGAQEAISEERDRMYSSRGDRSGIG